LSTSVPASPDSPPYLRPAPPYVRATVNLLAYCIQLVPASAPPLPSSPSSSATTVTSGKLKLTVFWQWSPGGAIFTNHHHQIAPLLAGFVNFVRERGTNIPLVKAYGLGLELSRQTFDRALETLKVEYAIVQADADDESGNPLPDGMDGVARQRERQKLTNGIELSLSSSHGWDVRVTTKAMGGAAAGAGAGAPPAADGSFKSAASTVTADPAGRVSLRLQHAAVVQKEHLVRATVTIQRLAGGKVVKVNGENQEIEQLSARDRTPRLLDDAASEISDVTSIGHESLSPSASSISVNTVAPSIAASRLGPEAVLSLLRRNYIYFTSLLQEPEAKWRHVSDSHGVTVTQLNSIDPTLTIYRAEATFVGVGVWDVFSTICTPGARTQWDKTLEDAVLLDDVNELSSLWWTKTKAAWPVSARDSVTIRTAYKSPSSVHIFSFSTDDTQLFPSIPPVESPAIRTQTDLYGWAIEALSPTTTQITLLDQSDPKGWSNKSWTPNQMVAAVAGVGDFSIKFGGPPVVTRLLGAKATLSKYEHENGAFKTEYRPTPAGAAAGSDDWDAVPAGGEGEGELAKVIECEIRCDCNTWATNIDVVVDPPPSRVSCLMRHRLSSGGGLWLSIAHDPAALGAEPVMVTVRKGAHGREKGSVTVNGARVKVDVEMLADDEVQLLSQRKRVKASPIPLDQYSTHPGRVWRGSQGGSPGRATPLPSPTPSAAEEQLVSTKSSPVQPSPLSQPPATIAPSTPPLPAAEEVLASQPPPRAPPAQALEALAWLQTFHAEQGPELTDPAPGWAIVSERAGTVVRKKVVAKVSEAIPVYRGDKIVQGLTAEEMVSVVLASGCRKAWDERIEMAIPLASYGHGIGTTVLTTKPSFPFKGRIVHVATVTAQTRVPSASSTSSTSTVLFVASASYAPDSTFDLTKLNPGSLQPGQFLLEGWILETLDPYASTMLAIPSTRCTYVSCVDQSGSVLALNPTLNTNIPKIISTVEALAKTKGPLPRLWTPEAGLQIEGSLADEGGTGEECVWRLSEPGVAGVAPTETVTAEFAVEDGAYRAMVRIGPEVVVALTAKAKKKKGTADRPASSGPVGAGAGGFLQASVPVGSISGTLPKSASLNFGTSPLLMASADTLRRKTSMGSLRLTDHKRSKSPPAPGVVTGGSSSAAAESPASTPSKLATLAAPTPTPASHDLVVAELVIDLKQFPHGYSISCSSALLPAEAGDPLSLDPLTAIGARQVPVRATAHDAPLPSILSASLDAWKRHQHLVRILVPTGAVTHPVQDPLRDAAHTGADKAGPEWFRKLADRGAVVEVRLVRLPEEVGVGGSGAKGGDKDKSGGGGRVMFNGEKLEVQGLKESRGVLGRLEDEDSAGAGWRISRVPRKKKAPSPASAAAAAAAATAGEPDSTPPPSNLPPALERPLAVAVRLLAPAPATPTPDDGEFPDPKSPGTLTPALASSELRPDARAAVPVASGAPGGAGVGTAAGQGKGRRDTAASDGTGAGPLLGILGAYPLARLGELRIGGGGGGGGTRGRSESGVSTVGASVQQVARMQAQAGYSLGFVVIVALIAFLLGSLLRSLLTPAGTCAGRLVRPRCS